MAGDVFGNRPGDVRAPGVWGQRLLGEHDPADDVSGVQPPV